MLKAVCAHVLETATFSTRIDVADPESEGGVKNISMFEHFKLPTYPGKNIFIRMGLIKEVESPIGDIAVIWTGKEPDEVMAYKFLDVIYQYRNKGELMYVRVPNTQRAKFMLKDIMGENWNPQQSEPETAGEHPPLDNTVEQKDDFDLEEAKFNERVKTEIEVLPLEDKFNLILEGLLVLRKRQEDFTFVQVNNDATLRTNDAILKAILEHLTNAENTRKRDFEKFINAITELTGNIKNLEKETKKLLTIKRNEVLESILSNELRKITEEKMKEGE
jgi:hypothetical protein